MDMVERVARAFEPVRWGNFDRYCEAKEYTPAERAERLAHSEFLQVSLRGARAAIEAMREPITDLTLQAASLGHDRWKQIGTKTIRAALTPSPALLAPHDPQ